jgi:hypothetical protein
MLITLCCISFFDSRILITPLVSSNSSYIVWYRNFGLPFLLATKIYQNAINERKRNFEATIHLFLVSFGISTKDDKLDLHWLYYIHILSLIWLGLPNGPRNVELKTFQLLTCILSATSTGLHSYYDTSYSRGGVNQMWVVKNSKDLCNKIEVHLNMKYH